MPYEPPTHTVERSMRATLGVRTVAGIDEVGRGAWAGPVTVCAAITGLRRPPEGLTDSKLITPIRRTKLAAVLTGWVTSYALGHASPAEIDDFGMTEALRLAASRALEGLPERPDAVILDGKHNYLGGTWRVRTVIKGDQSCVAVAAASVIAKVRRDAAMAELGAEYPRSLSRPTPDIRPPFTARPLRSSGRPAITGFHGRTWTRCPVGST